MELDFAMLAENAGQGVAGKLHVFGGGFNKVYVKTMPCDISPITLLARFAADQPDHIDHTITISITNPEKEEIELQRLESFRIPDEQSGEQVFAIVVAQMGLKLKYTGKYVFTLYLDDIKMKNIPLFVIPSEEMKGE